MTTPHFMPQCTGLLTLTIRDGETLEPLREQVESNVVTFFGTVLMMSIDGSYQSFDDTSSSFRNIYISDRITSAGLHTLHNIRGNLGGGFFIRENTEQMPWTFYDGNPSYGEKTGRFSSPLTTQTINTICLSHNTNNNSGTVASLNTPCIQNPGEVLDITYRIQFFYTTPSNSDIIFGNTFNENVAKKIVNLTSDVNWPVRAYPYWHKIPQSQNFIGLPTPGRPDNSAITGITINADTPLTNTIPNTQIQDNSNVISDAVNAISADLNGQIIRSVGFAPISGNNGTYNDGVLPLHVGVAVNWNSQAFPSTPVQNIHNHSANAVEWGLDVDFLATSTGSLQVDGTNWTQNDFPEFWRIDHNSSGDVGVSTYTFRNRKFLGFEGMTYLGSSAAMEMILWNNRFDEFRSVSNAHGIREYNSRVQYGDDGYVAFDHNGITIRQANAATCISFDAMTTPALNVASVQQVAVDTAGGIWVACASTGLHHITDPLGTASISTMSNATNNIPLTGNTAAYAVALAGDGGIWAVVQGGLIRCDDPLATTPTFNLPEPTFIFTGITDSNWNRVLYLRVDRDNADDQMAVVFTNGLPTPSNDIAWWSTAGVTIAGPTTGSHSSASTNNKFRVNVSARGSFWARRGPAFGVDNLQKLTWGTTTATDIGNGNAGYSTPVFVYDYYDVPHILGAGTSFDPGAGTTFGSPAPSVASIDNKHFAKVRSGSAYASNGIAMLAFEDGPARNITLGSWGQNITPQTKTLPPSYIQPIPFNTEYLDSLNGQHSPLEEMVWNRYGWNGSAWIKGYHAPAVDTSPNAVINFPLNSIRHNFDVENHTFTGRSMIDASIAMVPTTFTANATFTFTLIPTAKLASANDLVGSKQERPRVLLDISDATQQFQIIWDNTIQGSIQIGVNGVQTTITPTPSNNTSYRLVVVVNNNVVSVYLDGIQVGSNLTLANPYDWSNGLFDLKAFIGCRVYNWNDPSRTKPSQSHFYRGVMTNVQFWNIPWDATDVTNDAADPAGIIISKPSANLIARYDLTDSLTGTESKPTHTLPELLVDGVEISMTSGANAANSFIATDYHTFAMVGDGLLKDNATSFNFEHNFAFKPLNQNFAEFNNSTGISNIVDDAPIQMTEMAIFELAQPSITDSVEPINTLGGLQLSVNVKPGQVGWNAGTLLNSQSFNYGVNGMQPLTADGFVEFTIPITPNNIRIGFINDVLSSATFDSTNFALEFTPAGNVSAYESGALVANNVATYIVGDVFRIERVGTTITYQKITGGPTTLFTSAVASVGTMYIRGHGLGNSTAVDNVLINYTRPGKVMTIGSPVGLTGLFDPKFIKVLTRTPNMASIELNGTPAVVTFSNTNYDSMISPAPGEVVINGNAGWLTFNTADIGAVVTGNVIIMSNE